MTATRQIVLVLRAVGELLRYELLMATSGFKALSRRTGLLRAVSDASPDLEQRVLGMIGAVIAFYWKPVHCLQRSVVTVRILRHYGIDAQVVIGCRVAPVECHAWVEVNGRVVNDAAGYPQKLRILERF
jgi:hypothetical protein